MESNEVSESNINVEIKNSDSSENENIDDSQIRNDNMSNNKNEIKYDPEIEAKNYFNTLTDEEKKKLAYYWTNNSNAIYIYLELLNILEV